MFGINLSLTPGNTVIKGGGATALRREADGTVTILSLARTWTPRLAREADGTVTVN